MFGRHLFGLIRRALVGGLAVVISPWACAR
jgi:hypothetical protein